MAAATNSAAGEVCRSGAHTGADTTYFGTGGSADWSSNTSAEAALRMVAVSWSEVRDATRAFQLRARGTRMGLTRVPVGLAPQMVDHPRRACS